MSSYDQMIEHLLKDKKYNILLIDLQGHGLSLIKDTSNLNSLNISKFVDNVIVHILIQHNINNIVTISHNSSCLISLRLTVIFRLIRNMIRGSILICPDFRDM